MGLVMKKFALAVVTLVVALVPVSADAAPKHHDHKPSVQRVIDWD